jgi:hypothetical protein
MLHRSLSICLLAALPSLLACDPVGAPEGPQLPAPICRDVAPIVAGEPTFRDATADFGLDAIGVEGVRLNAADLDGDGWTDVIVRRGGVRQDELADGGARHTWLLRNVGGRFEDATLSSGLLATRLEHPELGRAGEVYAFGDVDNDGDLDVYTGLDTSDPGKSLGESSELMLNDGALGFSFAPRDSALRRPGDVDVPAGASFVDFDRDGALDLFAPQHNYTPAGGSIVFRGDLLYRGRGDGGFDDVSLDVGLVTEDWSAVDALNEGRAHSRAWGAAACDLNDDGMPELLVPSYGRSPNHLWQARAVGDDVRFDNRSVASGYAYDDDVSWTDNQFARCFCQSNPTADGCASAPAPAISCTQTNWMHQQDREAFRLGGNSAASVCADLDNDGDLDVVTSEIRHWWAGAGSDASEVLINTGEEDVRFARPGREALGLEVPHASNSWDEGHMTAAVLDLDNDGWLDLYVGGSDYPGNRGRLYRQAAPLSFEEIDASWGIDHARSHGVVVADFDRDGDQDLLVGHSRARCGGATDCYPTQQVRLFENLAGDGGNFVQLRLVGGEGSNRAAIGARVRLTAGDVQQTREVGGGHGHYGAQDDLVVHFGLGDACEADVEIVWPDRARTRQVVKVTAGHRFEIAQGRAPVVD